MKTIFKLLGITLASLLGLIVVLIIILKLIPDNQYKSWITSAVTSATGREFDMQALELDFGTTVRIAADGVRLANPDWAGETDLLSVGSLEAELKLWPLLSGQAEIRTALNTANIESRSNADGASNWDFDLAAPDEEDEVIAEESEGAGLPIKPVIRELRLEDVTLTIIDGSDASTKTAHLKQLLIETPELETTLTLDALAQDIPIQLSGSLGNIVEALDTAATPLDLKGGVAENTFSLAGDWGPVLPSANLDVKFDMKVPSTSSVAALAGYKVGDFGVLDLSTRARITDGVISVDDILTTLDGEQASSSISGNVSDVMLLGGVNIAVQMDTKALERLISLLNIELPVPLPPEVHLSAMIQGEKDGLDINDIIVDIVDEGVAIKLTAAIKDVLNSQQVNGDIHATLDSVSRLSKYANMELPALGAVELSGHIQSNGEQYQLQALDAQISADNLGLQVTGGVANLVAVDGIDANVGLNIDSFSEQNIAELTRLLESFGVELPVEMLPQSIGLNTSVRGSLEQLGLAGINAEVLDKGIKVALTGDVENILAPTGVTAHIELNSESVSAFSKYAGTELPDMGPLTATANLASNAQGLSLESLSANLADNALKADITASVENLIKISGIKASVTASTDTLAALSGLAQTELPDTDPLDVQVRLSAENLENSSVTAEAKMAGASISADSVLSLLNITDNLSLNVAVKAENLKDFEKLAQKELPDQGPLDLSATVKLEPNSYTLNELKLSLDKQSALGNATLQLPDPNDEKGITLLHGQLDIPFLDLSPLLPQPATEEEIAAAEAAAEAERAAVAALEEAEEAVEAVEAELEEPLNESERLLSSEPIILDVMQKYDIDFVVNADEIKFGETDVLDTQLKVTLKDGVLNIAPIQAIGRDGGTINGSIELDGRHTTPTLDANIVFEQIPMVLLGGAMDFNLDIDGQGRSVAELMASLNGQVLLVTRDGRVDKSIASRFGSGLLSFSSEKEYSELECFILRVDIVDGVADFEKKLAAQLTEVTWRGGGTVDFNTERLNADIVPKPRKGIPISVGGSLAGLVKLTGTLKNPVVRPDYSDAAIKYGKYSAYVATGGLTLLAEIIANKVTANNDVCESILNGTVFAEDKAGKKDNPPR